MNKKKYVISVCVMIAAIVILTINVLALMTDRESTLVNGTLGVVNTKQENLQIQTTDGTYGTTIANWNPGDVSLLEWDVVNKGNKSVDTRNTIVAYWDVSVSKDILESKTMYIYDSKLTDAEIRNDMENNNGQKALTLIDTKTIKTKNGDRLGYIFRFNGDTLSGVGTAKEEDPAKGDYTEGIYSHPLGDTSNSSDKLGFKIAFSTKLSEVLNRHMMGTPFTVAVITEAKQHRNTGDADWTIISNINDTAIDLTTIN